MELWKVYFPIKFIILATAIILANVHDEIRRCKNDKTATMNWGRSPVVLTIAFFVNVVLIGAITVLIKFYTEINLWFIFI